MRPTLLLFTTTIFFVSMFCSAQERATIQVFTPLDYQAETQNWSVSQSEDKYIYVANNKGLLEYNGAKWRLYTSPNLTILRSVCVVDSLIYTGCNREFGYWQRNEFGTLKYSSLSKELKIDFLEEEEVWNIIGVKDYILFQSLQRIYIYNKNTKTYNAIDSKTTITKMFKVNDDVYFQKLKDGVFKIETGMPKLVSNDEAFKENVLVNMFYHNDKILLETENEGFYFLKDNNIERWDLPANEAISQINVFRSAQLKDNSFVLGTRSNGIVHLTPYGEIDYKINTINGLSNNTIHCVFQDMENNIWLALDNGINCININSPFRTYNDEKGKIGTVYASAIFNDNLYLGTNQGLFYRPMDIKGGFTFIEGTEGVVWSLVKLDNTLFCGHDSGTFIVYSDKVEKIADVPGTWNIKPINNHLMLQGNYDGLYVLDKKDGIWTLRNKINGYNLSSKFFEMYGKSEVLVSHEYKGVFNVTLNDDYTQAIKVAKDSLFSREPNSSLIKYNEDILFACKQGVFKFNENRREFQKDTLLSKLIEKKEYISGRLVHNKENNTLWGFSKKSINYIAPGQLSNSLIVNKIPYSQSLPRGQSGYENITFLKDKKYLMGTSFGYLVVDLDKIYSKNHSISINTISKSILNHKNEVFINKRVNGEFKNKENNITFEYSVPEFDKYLDTEYQYQLIGIYNQWSDWTSESTIYFKNLPFGDYTFKVRGKVGNKITDNIASYGFTIERPWLLSNTMISVYLLIVALFSVFMHHVYKRYYRKQRERVEQKAKMELERKELQNKQQLMFFNNEKLRQDIDNKNRELGISTMSLIKKNEFLNTIKSELKKVGNTTHGVKSVMRMIDSNLNNTDDWNTFEEAFNNADKDFLKKIKSLHPSLTSNDLRLCAYLRLNLSSKEIAPLLNISSRSVEVKRYRLRKKLDLDHDASLSDYILEV